jgi:hypothetical protein
MQTSPNHQIPRPNLPAEGSSDTPVDLPQLFKDRDAVIDLMAHMPAGNIGDRPSAGNRHRFYIVLDQPDSPRIDWDNGSSWVTIYPSHRLLVTSLPVSPYDGQEVLYQANVGNGIVWHFRYNAGSASAYKWEFLGGGPLLSYIDGSTGSFTGTAIDKGGPNITLPFDGDYEVELGAYHNGGMSAGFNASLDFGGSPPHAQVLSPGGVSVVAKTKVTVLSTGVWKVLYSTTNPAGTSFSRRFASALPIRVG